MTQLTSVDNNNNSIPTDYSLEQNYPNPFNPATIIKYSIPKAGSVMIKVYDDLGKEVATLLNEYKSAGSYEVKFAAKKFSSGVYFYRLTAGDFVQTKRMIILK